jgi:hypothetical protein
MCPISEQVKGAKHYENTLHNNNYIINKVIKYTKSQKQNTDMDSQQRKTKWDTLKSTAEKKQEK